MNPFYFLIIFMSFHGMSDGFTCNSISVDGSDIPLNVPKFKRGDQVNLGGPEIYHVQLFIPGSHYQNPYDCYKFYWISRQSGGVIWQRVGESDMRCHNPNHENLGNCGYVLPRDADDPWVKSAQNLATCQQKINENSPHYMTVDSNPISSPWNCFYGIDVDWRIYDFTENLLEYDTSTPKYNVNVDPYRVREYEPEKSSFTRKQCECTAAFQNKISINDVNMQLYRKQEDTTYNNLFNVNQYSIAKECVVTNHKCAVGEIIVCDGKFESLTKPNTVLPSCLSCSTQTFSNAQNSYLCRAKTECTKTTSETVSEGSISKNNECRCLANYYADLKIEWSGTWSNTFQADQGECKPCKTTVECNDGTNNTKYVARGCNDGRNAICVCNKGYERISTDTDECTPCKEGYYKEHIDEIIPVSTSPSNQEKTGQTCGICPSTQMTTVQGATTKTECDCPASMFFKEGNVQECVPCHHDYPQKPYRKPFTENCTECPSRSKFNVQNLEKGCEKWESVGMVMQIQCINPTWRISPSYDQFIRDSTSSRIETLDHLDDYWKRAYANVNAKTWKITDLFKKCSNCAPGEYRIACGGPVRLDPEFGSETYQIALNINGTLVLKTLDAQFECSEDYDQICPGDNKSPQVEILREGKCEKCTSCGIGSYVDGCGANDAGSCKTCDVCRTEENDLIASQQYLYHPKPLQCDGSATQDCERRKCDKSKKEETPGLPTKYKIGIECGEHDVEIWDETTPRLENVEIQTRIITGKGKFEQGKLARYCPSGYYVDPNCFKEDEDWDPQCCILCKLHDALQKRSSAYRECPGDEDSDTQTYIERCENGFYETTVSDTETTSICKPCTTCSFS